MVDASKKDGLTYECKECRYDANSKRKEEIRKENPNLGKLQCVTCENYEDLKMFFRTKVDKDGIIGYINKCKNCYCKENGESKQCFTCKEIKNLTDYDKTTANADGRACYCKSCRKIQRDKERDEKRKTKDENDNKKECSKCKKHLEFNMFFKHISDGESVIYYDDCMDCNAPNSLQCNRCCEIKGVSSFSKDSAKKTGYRTICKKCTNSKARSNKT